MNDLDLAAHRLVSREASTSDIDLLAQRSAAGEDVLAGLLAMARDDAAARAQIGTALASAEAIELPHAHAHARDAPPRARLWPLRLAAPGWLAAAVVALMWGAMGLRQGEAPGPGALPVAYTPTVEEALNQYLQTGAMQGRVIGELPALMVETRPLEQGTEIVYMRRLLERTVVDEIVEQDVDDTGRIVERRVSPAAFARPEEL